MVDSVILLSEKCVRAYRSWELQARERANVATDANRRIIIMLTKRKVDYLRCNEEVTLCMGDNSFS